MNSGLKTHISDCGSVNLTAYIDGELDAIEEKNVGEHVALCPQCAEKLNEHKNFLNILNRSLDDGPDLPADFARKIVARAESDVSGLRDKRESRRALMILGILTVFAFSIFFASGKIGILAEPVGIVDRTSALIGVVAQFIFSAGLTFSVIFKTVTQDVPLGLTLFLFVICGLVFLSMLTTLIRFRRHQKGH